MVFMFKMINKLKQMFTSKDVKEHMLIESSVALEMSNNRYEVLQEKYSTLQKRFEDL